MREKLHKLAQTMGYRPNPLMAAHWNTVRARRPVSYKATIAVLNDMDSGISWASLPWCSELFHSFRLRCEALGYVVEELHVGAPEDPERRRKLAQVARIMQARGIAAYAVFLCNHPRRFVEAAAHFEEFSGVFICSQGIPVAAATPSTAFHLPFHRVNPERYGNMLLLLDKLHATGYRRPGFWPNQWMEAINEGDAAAAFALWTQRLPSRDRIPIHNTSWNSLLPADQNQAAFLKWLEKRAPDVVICENCEVRHWLEKAGRKIPRDVGLAHLALGPMEPGWSGINIHRERIASAGADLLTAHLQRNERGTPPFPKAIQIDGSWVQGSTTKVRRSRG